MAAPGSIYRLRLREGPFPVQDFGARTIETNRVEPARHDRQAVGNLSVASAELDRDRIVRVLPRGDIVERIRAVFVRLEITLGIVDADRPEAVNGHISHIE